MLLDLADGMLICSADGMLDGSNDGILLGLDDGILLKLGSVFGSRSSLLWWVVWVGGLIGGLGQHFLHLTC